MSKRQLLGAAAFAAIWSAGMIWLDGDYSLVKIVLMSVCGMLVGLAWVWSMTRLGFWK